MTPDSAGPAPGDLVLVWRRRHRYRVTRVRRDVIHLAPARRGRRIVPPVTIPTALLDPVAPGVWEAFPDGWSP